MVEVLGRSRLWTSLLVAGFVALLVLGTIRGDTRGGFVDDLHGWVKLLCALFALGVVVTCVGNAVRDHGPGNLVAAVLAVLGVVATVGVEVATRSEGPDSPDFGAGAVLLLGLILTVLAGLVTEDVRLRD